MPFAVLSPCALDAQGKDERVHYNELAALLENLYRFTDLQFQIYKKAPFDGYKMEIPIYTQFSHLNNLVAVNIYGKIQKMLSGDYVDLDGYPPAKLPDSFCIRTDSLSIAFCSYLSYLEGKEAVLFIGEANSSVPRPVEVCANNTFRIDTSTYLWLELSDVLLPYLKDNVNCDEIFPRALFCSKYNEYVIKTINEGCMDQSGKNALFESVGATVAAYNMYTKNTRLSKLNTTRNKKRIVYEKQAGKKYYLSLDLESGGFEVFDRSYRHLGQFSFSCNKVRPEDPENHKLIH